MSLVAANLTSALAAFAVEGAFPETYAEAGQKWADAYTSYASTALTIAGGSSPLIPPSATVQLAAELAGIFESKSDGGVGQRIATALSNFWIAPPVPFGGPYTGAVASTAGITTLPAALKAAMDANIQEKADAQTSCQRIADAIHTFTLTVMVLLVAPIPAPGLTGIA